MSRAGHGGAHGCGFDVCSRYRIYEGTTWVDVCYMRGAYYVQSFLVFDEGDSCQGLVAKQTQQTEKTERTSEDRATEKSQDIKTDSWVSLRKTCRVQYLGVYVCLLGAV